LFTEPRSDGAAGWPIGNLFGPDGDLSGASRKPEETTRKEYRILFIHEPLSKI